MRSPLVVGWTQQRRMAFPSNDDHVTASSPQSLLSPGSIVIHPGLSHLEAGSYRSSANHPPTSTPAQHTHDDIRDLTMELSDLPLPSTSFRPASVLSKSHSSATRQIAMGKTRQMDYFDLPTTIEVRETPISPLVLSVTTPTSEITTPTLERSDTARRQNPSGLSVQLARRGISPQRTLSIPAPSPSAAQVSDHTPSSGVTMTPSPYRFEDLSPVVPRVPDESTALLPQWQSPTVNPSDSGPISYSSIGTPIVVTRPGSGIVALVDRSRVALSRATTAVSKLATREAYLGAVASTFQALPAVILGLLLNILDGVSYGMIMFPAGPIFDGFGAMGVSMFFMTTILSQLVYTFVGSAFAGGNGSMMIEVVPFFHILTTKIIEDIGEDNPPAIIATTLAAFTLSSLLTGLTFYILGRFNLGVIIGFFPRHILVGCIGGVGVFLMETGLEVSAGLNESGGFQYNMDTFRLFFLNSHVLSLWLPALGLAMMLRVITHFWHNQLVFPGFFLLLPVAFYIIVAIIGVDLNTLRSEGWVFDLGSSDEPWWKIYTYWDFGQISFSTLLATMPTQFAMLFFNILHPPLNVPALAVSLDQDVNTNHELVMHGYSNLIAAVTGNAPNYLVYVNTLLFYKVGGGTRVAGFLLACATAALLYVGTGPIGYMPVLLVGALIFVLGIDLIKEALWDTRHRVSWPEYVTIIAIMVCMTFWDFVIGVLFGIVLACFFFVVQNSQTRSVRAEYTGDSTLSTVRRPSAHRQYLREVACQTAIMKLQSYLFFGTINYVEDRVRALLDHASWNLNPIRFLIMDLSLCLGVDLSAAEAFVRIQRLLASKGVSFILCGVALDSKVGQALHSVDLFASENVELFSSMNEAMEWTENAYLKAWFVSQKSESEQTSSFQAVITLNTPKKQFILGESFENSPRRSHLHRAGGRLMIAESPEPSSPFINIEPIPTLLKVFSGYESDLQGSFFSPILPFLQRVPVPEGHILWNQGDMPDGLYVIASGVMRANYVFDNATISESMVSGTLAGELSALSGMPRNATVVAERESVLWRLSLEDMEKFEAEAPEAARKFTKLVLRVAKSDYDVLVSACSRL